MMEKQITLPNSPIEFVVVGPTGGHDRILVRSENAGLDVIGLAAQAGIGADRDGTTGILAAMFGKARQLNVVTSFAVVDMRPEIDARTSRFSFAWNGLASPRGVERVKEALNAALPDLRLAVQAGDMHEIEWTLSPVIYQCTQANERRLRSRRVMLISLGLYAGLGLLAILYQAIRRMIVF